MERNRSSNPGENRAPGRVPVSGPSGEAPTQTPEPAQRPVTVLGAWAANSPDQQDPRETALPVLPAADPDEPDEPEPQGPLLDPDSPFGHPAPRRIDPPMPGARVDADASASAARTKAAASTASFPDAGKAPNPLATRGRAAVFAKLAAAAVMAVSGLLNERLAVDDEDETWLADDEDMKAMGEPAGRLIARKLPLPEGTDTTDLADAIEIAIGAAGYAAKNTVAWVRSIRERRRATAGAALYQES